MTLTRKIKINRKAFTLVEVLAVVVIIAILAAAIMFASDELVSSAQAARILENLENWKKATLAWYTDHISIVLDNGMIDKNYRTNTSAQPSAFREDWGGSGYGVITARDLMPYLSMSGLTVTDKPPYPGVGDYQACKYGVVDGYGGRYLTDYETIHEKGKKADYKKQYEENDMEFPSDWDDTPDEYVWMIDYKLPNMSDRVKEKLQRKYVDTGILFWKIPSKTLLFNWKDSKELNSIGIKVMSFKLENK